MQPIDATEEAPTVFDPAIRRAGGISGALILVFVLIYALLAVPHIVTEHLKDPLMLALRAFIAPIALATIGILLICGSMYDRED